MDQTIPTSSQTRVKDIMTINVIKVQPDTRVSKIARLMSDYDVSGLPVVDANDKVVGVVTELDMIVRNTHFDLPRFIVFMDSIIPLETPSHYEERLEKVLGTTAQEIMSEPAVTIGPEATIEELTELMVNRRMNPIPVVEGERLVGIVSRSDIIHLMAENFGIESEMGSKQD